MSSPVAIYMYVQPGTLTPVPPRCRLYEDPNRPTPALTLVTVLDNAASDGGSYSTTACQAIVSITATDWANLCTLLADHSQQVRVDMTYDDAAIGTTKPLIAGPTFTAVPLAGSGLLAQVASAVHAVEERVETGVSSDIRADIHHTKTVVDDMAKTLDGMKATLDAVKNKVDRL